MTATNAEARAPAELHSLAVAGLSGRRLRLFARARMGVRGGRRRRRRDALGLARAISSLSAAPRSDAILFALAFRAARAGDWSGLLDDQRTRGRARPARRSGGWRRSRKGARFLVAARAAWDVRGAAPPRRARTASRRLSRRRRRRGGRPRLRASTPALRGLRRSLRSPISSRRRCAWARSARPTARRFWRGSCPPSRALAHEAAAATLDDLGACAFRSDIAAMRHETQYSRLFRS